MSDKGLISGDKLERISLRVNLENKLKDWLTIGARTTFSNSDYSGVSADVGLVDRQSPYGNWYREDGTPTQHTVPEDQTASTNPMYDKYYVDDANYRNNLFANFYASMEIPKIK